VESVVYLVMKPLFLLLIPLVLLIPHNAFAWVIGVGSEDTNPNVPLLLTGDL
jgi:hypothetical protein